MNLELLQKGIKYLLVPIVIIIALLWVSWWIFFNEPKADRKFGNLKPPQINTVISDETKIASIVQIESAENITNLALVYKKTPVVPIDKIAKVLGFNDKPKQIGKQPFWVNSKGSLRLKSPTSRFSFLSLTKIEQNKISVDEAVGKAKEILINLGLVNSDQDLVTTGIKKLVYEKQNAFEVSNGEFDIYSVSFGLDLNSISVLNDTGGKELANVWVGVDGSIQKMEADSQPMIVGDSSTYKIKSLTQAKDELEGGKGIVVNTTKPLRASTIITYTRVELAYYFAGDENKYIQPVFLFVGRGFGAAVVTTLLPAVE